MFEAKATFFATIDGQNVTFVPLSTQQVRQSIFLLVMAMIWPILTAVSAHKEAISKDQLLLPPGVNFTKI
jgi:Mg2+ and Co2+ transporter CorA